LQIVESPDRINEFYDSRYYSFNRPKSCFDNPIKAFSKRLRLKYYFSNKTLFSFIFLKVYSPPMYFVWLKEAGVNPNSRILDVGCGSGDLLVRMRKDGFRDLTGFDPYIEKDILYENGVIIYKKDISEINNKYDFIMLHHSYEHMWGPVKVLEDLSRILNSNRYLLIRIPVIDSYAWKKYRENWVSLDAPRHLFLHTEKSMHLIAEKTGLEIKKIVYDSDEFQFWGSEQYLKGIALREKRSLAEGFKNSIFSKNEIKEFKKKACELNRIGQGDQASFYLFKP